MRHLTTAVLAILLSTGSLFAVNNRAVDGPDNRQPDRGSVGRHYVLQPEGVLTDRDRLRLSEEGIVVREALTNGRYLVRVRPGATLDDPSIRTLVPLTAEKKIHRGAMREAVSGRAFARVNLLFHDDVPFEQARQLVIDAGGALESPLQVAFSFPNRLPALVPATSVREVASDERVLLVYGPRTLKMSVDNASAAQISHVNEVQAAPYGLTGAGVTLSYFELAAADVAHPEFGGRLTVNGFPDSGTAGNAEHATHVAGTMIASGIEPAARGMAPAATLQEFSSQDDDLLGLKQALPAIFSVADNNSWGYVLGWNKTNCDPDCVWGDTDAYYGAYDVSYTAPFDQLARSTSVLLVHSAGNDATKTGPGAAPFAHKHEDQNGDVIPDKTWCYSANASGTDCPVTVCTAGAEYCETTRHPRITSVLDDPWMSVGLVASAKNVMTVGAVDLTKQITSFSSRGPTRDGRVKPEIVTKGSNLYSTRSGGGYVTKSGTSMAAPVVTGSAALLVEQWRKTNGGTTPTGSVLKTLMISGAEDLGLPGPDYTYGFGLLNVKASVDTIIANGTTEKRIKNQSLAQSGRFETSVSLASPQSLRVVLGWADPEVVVFPDDGLATSTLVNDLDLTVIGPSGATALPYVLDMMQPAQAATRGVNTIDTTEEVEIAGAQAGTYRIVVTGTRVAAQSPQGFTLIADADMAPTVIPCVDMNEPNGSEATAVGSLPAAQPVGGRICESGDVDFYRFVASVAGTVSVRVTATDTPLRVTLTSSAGGSSSVDVAAGQTQTASLLQAANSTTTYYVKVVTTGTVGSNSRYTVTPSFPQSTLRRRNIGRR